MAIQRTYGVVERVNPEGSYPLIKQEWIIEIPSDENKHEFYARAKNNGEYRLLFVWVKEK